MKISKKVKLAIREAALEVYDLSKKDFEESKQKMGFKTKQGKSQATQQKIKWHAKNK
ncbi:hypothetical protein [Enterococcus camelliae]|uniref:Uncharacterized protein n=1 Tax=Enterococcus camelliae TaxID=453959 RepID=A0ABW5TN46_9ENTE